jgi:hypothetical protein
MAAMKPGEVKQRLKEDCRRAVRDFLVNRSVLAFSAHAIADALKKGRSGNRRSGSDFSVEEVKAALQFEVGAGRVSETHDPQGATPYYKATAEGVLFHERNQPNK